MASDLLALAANSKAINSKAFSVPRILILSAISELRGEGASFRELRDALSMKDGTIFANLNALIEMRYIRMEKTKVNGEKTAVYYITDEGTEGLLHLKEWAAKWVGGHHGKPE